MMTDLIGTIRHEAHDTDDGYTVWVKTGAPTPNNTLQGRWVAMYSTAPVNVGMVAPAVRVEIDANPVVGAIPGTPAGRR